MIRSVQLHRLTSHILSCTRGSCLLTGQMPYGVQPSSPGHTSMQQIFHGPLIPKITALGDVSFYLVSYTTGIALFAGVMLYTASHFFRRVVGMMYLDPSQTTLKVSHLTFWGKRHDIYLPVSDVMTIGDTGDSANETILKLKRYSSPQTLYFSMHFGRVMDRQGFEKVFGNLK
ncbi:transmembrane protein 186 isoform X3 [Toxotes jaculatrix]|uniref:transmembrane protein 186 isoform X3 n=1 Tax=Toxotes jaculatrix TaxID=941984 RepID=UPI001B3AEF82|nr:transmembrane protein 186 isoform X3 [Toxotes jaculatrix]